MIGHKNEPIRKKSLGQVFLNAGAPIRRVVDDAVLGPDDRVIEIGGGDGRVSAEIANRVADLTIVEIDRRFVEVLREKFVERDSVRIVAGDILAAETERAIRAGRIDWRFVVYGSIPYYITSPIMRWLLERRAWISRAALLMQREVAERAVAGPGGKEYGFLSVIMQLGAAVRLGPVVGRRDFTPVPKVDSRILHIDLDAPGIEALSSGELRILSALFQHRRKQMGTVLRQFADVEHLARVEAEMSGRGMALSDRPERHSPAALRALCRAVLAS